MLNSNLYKFEVQKFFKDYPPNKNKQVLPETNEAPHQELGIYPLRDTEIH